MVNELVESIAAIGRLLEISPVSICILLEDEFFSDDDEDNEELRDILNDVYLELDKMET